MNFLLSSFGLIYLITLVFHFLFFFFGTCKQKKASDMMKHITIETIQQLYLTTTPRSLGIADLGCSSGPNTLSFIKDMFDAVEGTSSKTLVPGPEFRVYLNDLPTNDFNTIFKALPDFYKDLGKGSKGRPSIFIAGIPGSFYGRLFPNNCLHFIYSSYSLHWLSQVINYSLYLSIFLSLFPFLESDHDW